jgi:hypothetical protein
MLAPGDISIMLRFRMPSPHEVERYLRDRDILRDGMEGPQVIPAVCCESTGTCKTEVL